MELYIKNRGNVVEYYAARKTACKLSQKANKSVSKLIDLTMESLLKHEWFLNQDEIKNYLTALLKGIENSVDEDDFEGCKECIEKSGQKATPLFIDNDSAIVTNVNNRAYFVHHYGGVVHKFGTLKEAKEDGGLEIEEAIILNSYSPEEV